jgi:hypothetical protein
MDGITALFRSDLWYQRVILLVAGWVLLILLMGERGFAGTLELGARLGYSSDHLDWNIGGVGGSPNVLSELTFSRIRSGVALLEGRWREERWFLEGELGYGLVSSGSLQDDDFDGNNRTGLFSRSRSSIDGHDLQSAAVSAGVVLLERENVSFRVLLGTRYYAQRLRFTHGQQIESRPSPSQGITPPPVGPIDGLNSTYTAKWFGPTLGLAGTAAIPSTPVWLRLSATWLPWLNYSGEGRFNLRSDFRQDPSVSHSASGSGVVTDLALMYPFLERFELSTGWRYMWFSASNGSATTHFKTSAPTVTSFNEVHARSNLFYVGVTSRW